jgi:hypothetical protein
MPHLRRGHLRTYASGVQTFVRDTIVNVTDAERADFRARQRADSASLGQRSHYVVKE